MVKIRWSELAIDDLNNIADFYSKYSLDFTSAIIRKLLNKPQVLKEMPELGRKVPEQDDVTIRELIEGNYRIIYQYDKQSSIVEIITVYHSSRLFK